VVDVGRGIRLPLSEKTRRIIQEYLSGEKMTHKEFTYISVLRKRLKELDFNRCLEDLKLLKALLEAKRRAYAYG